MIRWHHPRIYQRLRCFGLSLFTFGLASRNVDNPPAAIAAIIVTVMLLVRLKIELDIRMTRMNQPLSENSTGSSRSIRW